MAFEGSNLVNLLLKMTKGSMASILDKVCPPGLKDRIKQALEYANGGSEGIQAICETKQTFYSAGFACSIKTQNKNNKGKFEANIAEQMRVNKLTKVVEELTFDYVACDNCILHWKIDGDEISYVQTLSPGCVDYDISTQAETLKIQIPDAMKIAIRTMDIKNKAETEKVYPQKYVDAVRKGASTVELQNKDGEYWVVRTRGRRFTGLANPSMSAIFRDVFIREMLIGGDWAIAYFFKRVIEHVKVGESANQLCDSATQLYGTTTDFTALEAQYKKVGETMRLFTDHTVEIEYLFPDPKVFSPEKYVSVEERISRWGAVPEVLLTGKGEGFAQGSIGVRRFLADGKRVREAIGDVLEDFFMHPEVMRVLNIPKGSQAYVEWDEQILKDPEQVLSELTALYDRGALSDRTMDKTLGYNLDMEVEYKTEELKLKQILMPLFEPKQGMLSGDNQGGRPKNGKPQAAPSKRPRPSTSGGSEADLEVDDDA